MNRRAPTWLFGLTSLPFGVGTGFAGFAMPFILRKAGVPVQHIAEIYALTMIPSAYQFLWAPVIDVGPRRRTWLMLVAAVGAACLCASLMLPLPSSLGSFVVLVVAGQAFISLVGSCNGGLMATTLPDEVRGAAGGWMNAGNLGGAALGAGVTLWLAERCSARTVGLALAAMIVLPSLAVLGVHEAKRARRAAREVFGTTLRDVWSTLKSRPGLTGILFCLSPVGTAAATNLFSGVATDYHAPAHMVTFATGFAGGLVSAVGALLGGYLCDRINRRLAYVLSGAATALAALGMLAMPLTPWAYAAGSTLYLFVSGFCYAAFSAVVLEVIGSAGGSASAQYTLFTAAGNQAIAYTTWIDGHGYAHGGPRGLLAADATANAIGIVFLALMMLVVSRLKRPQEKALAA